MDVFQVRGDYPETVTEAAVVCCNFGDLNARHAMGLFVYSRPGSTSADAKTFELVLSGGEDADGMPSFGMVPEFASLESRFTKPALAMPTLVARSEHTRHRGAAEQERLASLFAVWLRDVEWDDCRMTAINRPSLASWNGYPWDSDYYRGRSLARDFTKLDLIQFGLQDLNGSMERLPEMTGIPLEFAVQVYGKHGRVEGFTAREAVQRAYDLWTKEAELSADREPKLKKSKTKAGK